jgi:uncharacterized YccA/Bax inhibitor family protein
MALMRTSNPVLNANAFQVGGIATGEAMTISGTVNKTGILLLCTVATAFWTWNAFLHSRSAETVLPLVAIGGIGGLVLALVTVFKKEWSPVTAPVYALLEGLVLGGISALLELRFPGIAIQAVGLTFGTFFALLLAYRSGLVRATENFKLGVVAATGGIALLYLAMFLLGLFGIRFTTLNSATPMGIAFSLFVVVIAALNLVLDFDFIENGARGGAQVHGVVRGLRPDGHPDLAVPGNPAPARQGTQPEIVGRACRIGTAECVSPSPLGRGPVLPVWWTRDMPAPAINGVLEHNGIEKIQPLNEQLLSKLVTWFPPVNACFKNKDCKKRRRKP